MADVEQIPRSERGLNIFYRPDKITKTVALAQYRLKPHQLLPHTHPSIIGRQPPKLFPQIRYGTYISNCTTATMFLRLDVEKLAELVHGDLWSHRARPQIGIDKWNRGKEKPAKYNGPIGPAGAHSHAEKGHQDRLVI